MKITIIVVVILALIGIRLFLASAGRKTDGGSIVIADIPKVTKALSSSGSDGSFAVILVPDRAGSDGYNANLQFSIDNSRFGFDWVLMAEQNISDRERVEKLARSLGYRCREKSQNDVNFLRCEGAREYDTLAKTILTEIYGISESQRMRLIIESFDWQPRT